MSKSSKKPSVIKAKRKVPASIAEALQNALQSESYFITVSYKDVEDNKLKHMFVQEKYPKEDVAISLNAIKEDFNKLQVIK